MTGRHTSAPAAPVDRRILAALFVVVFATVLAVFVGPGAVFGVAGMLWAIL